MNNLKFSMEKLIQSLLKANEEALERNAQIFQSFEEVQKTETIDGLELTFDPLSLCLYKTNFTPEQEKVFYSLILEVTKYFPKGKRQARDEYVILRKFFSAFPELSFYKFRKQERPDFMLEKENGIGVEVTELYTQQGCYLRSLDNDAQKSNKSITREELQEKIEKFNPQLMGKLIWPYIENPPFVGSPLQELDKNREELGIKLAKKFNKYDMKKCERFCILCDATEGIEVTERWEAKKVIEIAKQNASHKTGFTVYILYCDQSKNGKVEVAKFIL